MASVFLSYRTVDGPRVEAIVAGLRADGLSVWWDQDLGGRPFHEAIGQELAQAAVVVVALSAAWAVGGAGGATPWTLGEIESAAGRIVVAQIGPLARDQIPVPLRGLNHIDLTRWSGDSQSRDWRALVNRCIEMAARAGHSTGQPSAQAAPASTAPAGSDSAPAGIVVNAGMVIGNNSGPNTVNQNINLGSK